MCKLDNPLLANVEWVRVTTPLWYEHLVLKSDWEDFVAEMKKECNAAQ